MRTTRLLMPTLREVPAEAEILSHRLMLRAGLIRKLSVGVYSYLPVGLRVLRKVENIVREEMDRAGAQELLMSALLASESFEASGRYELFGPEMFRLQDRSGRAYCLGPTHEEIFTETVKATLRSYKELPMTLYQIQTKYRDERRPRFGVMRSREFIMKDAYSFDLTAEGLDESYKKMHDAYCAIFDRLGMSYVVVDADSGAMGGSGSQEFMVKSEVGEDTICHCEACGYGANIEKASCPDISGVDDGASGDSELVHTPDVHTIDELCGFFKCGAKEFLKCILYKADNEFVIAAVRGDREISETKLKNALNVSQLEMAAADDIIRLTGAEVGFLGPVNVQFKVYADSEVKAMSGYVCGANKTNYHLKNVGNSDFKVEKYLDLRQIEDGDPCPRCGAPIKLSQGVEVGHIFKLGTKYTAALDLNVSNEKGEAAPVIMGSYGIGVNRCIAAIIEQNNDDAGIIWPESVAPYAVAVVPVKNDCYDVAEQIYQSLMDRGVEVLIDDRAERAGVKFNDMDLLGIPIRITVGKKAADGIVEVKRRGDGGVSEISVEDAKQLKL